MAKWLASGRRRDVCYVLAREGELSGQRLKARLEDHYDERIEPGSFYAGLEALVDAGHVATHREGIEDIYTLTAAGRERLEAHHEWASACLAD